MRYIATSRIAGIRAKLAWVWQRSRPAILRNTGRWTCPTAKPPSAHHHVTAIGGLPLDPVAPLIGAGQKYRRTGTSAADQIVEHQVLVG